MLAALLLAVQFLAPVVFAALEFPALSGRVVDTANLLNANQEREITQQLEQHETETSNQIVVVTLPSLQGTTIEDFGYQLGRHWGVGQQGRNNGLLLIVAPKERKVRIEVGYGLEGDLPDAITKAIIEQEILPEFRSGNFPGGIAAGVDTLLTALGGSYAPIDAEISEAERRDAEARQGHMTPRDRYSPLITFLMVLAVILAIYLSGKYGGGYGGNLRGFGSGGDVSGGFGGEGGSGGGGGGFSGGGGSFGGGGSSGSW